MSEHGDKLRSIRDQAIAAGVPLLTEDEVLEERKRRLVGEEEPPVVRAWRTDPPPIDGTWILGLFGVRPHVVYWECWEVGGEMCSDGTGSPPDGVDCFWVLAGDPIVVMGKAPDKWAEIEQAYTEYDIDDV